MAVCKNSNTLNFVSQQIRSARPGFFALTAITFLQFTIDSKTPDKEINKMVKAIEVAEDKYG